MKATLIAISAAICIGLAWWGIGSLGDGFAAHRAASEGFAFQAAPTSQSRAGADRGPRVARVRHRPKPKHALDSPNQLAGSNQPAGPVAGEPGRLASPSEAPLEPAHEDEIEPYSKHPSELKPHYVCPPPTNARPSCDAVGAPNSHKLAAAGMAQPGYEGSGISGGFSPADLRSAYDLPEGGGEGVTVAITIAFDYPTAEEDLAAYRSQYGLPACTGQDECFKRVNQEGEEGNYPSEANAGWNEEAALDLDMVSAACPRCHLILVEAESNFGEGLYVAVETAAGLGADVISDSWGFSGEYPEETADDHHFDQPGIPVLFASGDSGYGAQYPASSPGVIAVGGTSLKKAQGGRGWSESAWGGAGSGCSAYEDKPAWQHDEGCAKRTVADVSAVADPYTPVSVRIHGAWAQFGGTSVAAPLMAGVEAISSAEARSAGAGAFPRIGMSEGLFDPTEGENAYCGTYLCQAEVGYDGPTGWGTPDGPLSLPVAVTEQVTVESEGTATLHGSVDPHGLDTDYRFEYGETSSYGTSVPVPDEDVGSGHDYVGVSQAIEGLKGGTTYHYRIVAANAEGIFHGIDRTFGTSLPSVTTEAATGVHGNDATLNARVDPEGAATRYWFEYGPSSEYGFKVPLRAEEIGSGAGVVEVSEPVGPLMTEQTYHFRIAAKNAAGTVYGSDRSLTTASPDWSYEVPSALSQATNTTDISCFAQGECMVIAGRYVPTEPPETKMSGLLKDGSWSVSEMPRVEEAEGFYPSHLSCTSASWCSVVGEYTSSGKGIPLAESWNGEEWIPAQLPPLPAEATGGQLDDVSCTSRSFCMAVGSYGTATRSPFYLVDRWDGVRWSAESLEVPGNGRDLLYSVSCVSPSSCVVAGYHVISGGGWAALALDWDGESWRITQDMQPSGDTYAYLGQVSCASADSCTAIGTLGEGEAAEAVTPEHWNGESWQSESWSLPAGARGENIQGLDCPSPSRCVAVGFLTHAALSSTPAVFAWDGTGWSYEASDEPVSEAGEPLGFAWLKDVSCATASSCVGMTEGFDETWWNGTHYYVGLETPDAVGPVASTGNATNVKPSAATLRATVDPAGQATTYQFEYGKTNVYGSKAPDSAEGIGGESEDTEVEAGLKGLTPATTYHYRVVATSAGGTSYGEDRRFTTRAPAPSFSASIGEKGSSEGQVDEPYAVVTDPENNIWVVDTENNRIEKLSPQGKLLLQFGSAGTGDGQLQQPLGLAIGGDGEVWVADTLNNRIEVFGSEGKFLKAFGWGVVDGKGELQVCEANCRAGIGGTGAGQFDRPVGLSFDSNGDLWVVNFWGQSIEEFSRQAELLTHFGTGPGDYVDIALDQQGNVWTINYLNHVKEFNQAGEVLLEFGSQGSGDGQFDFPTGIDVDSEEDVWVADSENGRIEEFNHQGEYLAQFGENGSGDGQMDFPRGVAFDSEGNIWVVDTENSRIEKWSYGPSAVSEAATGITPYEATLNASVDPQGLETTYQFEYGESTSYGSSAPIAAASLGDDFGSSQVAATVRSLKPETTYHYRVVASNASGKTYGADMTFTTHAKMPSFFTAAGSNGSEPGQFRYVDAVATDAKGDVWATDSSLHHVEEFNERGEYLTEFGSQGSGKGQFFGSVKGIAFDKEGHIWVSNTDGSDVDEFSAGGEYLSQIGDKYGSRNGEFEQPMGVAIDQASGEIYVVDSYNDRVQIFNAKGEYLSKFGSQGSGKGQFVRPSGIAIDESGDPGDGDVYVIDGGNNGTGNDRVEKFTSSGEYLDEVRPAREGSFESHNESFVGVAVDGDGNVFVADTENDRIQEFSPEGAFLGWFGGYGEGAGKFTKPSGVAVDSTGNVWVGDQYRVERWSYPDAPLAITEAATSIGGTQATLNGTVAPEGSPTVYYFEYGTTTSYGSAAPPTAAWAGSGGSRIAVSQSIALQEGTTYHYRLVAESEVGTTYGEDETFTAPALPAVTTEAATAIGPTQAGLNGTVDPEGFATSYYFEYGLTESYGSNIPASPVPVGSGTSGVAVSQTPTGLQPGATYHYRLVATNAAGTVHGADMTLATTAALRWQACEEQEGGRFATSECAAEGSPKAWELRRLPEGEETPVGSSAGTFAVSSRIGLRLVTFTCEAGLGEAKLENPQGGGDGSGKSKLDLSGCKAEGTTFTACSVAAGAPHAVGFQLATQEGETRIALSPAEGTTLATLTLSGPECPYNGIERILTGVAYGLYSNPASRLEFTSQTTASGLNLNGIKATASGALGLRSSGGGGSVEALRAPVALTEAASAIEPEKATLKGFVGPGGLDTHYHFEYIGQRSFVEHGYEGATSAPVEAADAGGGLALVEVGQPLPSLVQGAIYHYRLVATSVAGTTYGADTTFETTAVPLRWQACEEQEGGRFATSECAAEGSPKAWELRRLPEGEETPVGSSAGTFAVSSRIALGKVTLACEAGLGEAKLENPKGGGDGSGKSKLDLSGCKAEGTYFAACSVTVGAPRAVGFQLATQEGETRIALSPAEGTTLATFTFSGSKCPVNGYEPPLTGVVYGLYSNSASQLEFTSQTTASGLNLNGIKATASGALGLRSSGGGGSVEAGTS